MESGAVWDDHHERCLVDTGLKDSQEKLSPHILTYTYSFALREAKKRWYLLGLWGTGVKEGFCFKMGAI